MNDRAKEIIVRELKQLVWMCHKNDFDAEQTQHEFFRFRGMTFALCQAGLISKEHRKMMNENSKRVYWKARKKAFGGVIPLPNVAVDGHKPV